MRREIWSVTRRLFFSTLCFLVTFSPWEAQSVFLSRWQYEPFGKLSYPLQSCNCKHSGRRQEKLYIKYLNFLTGGRDSTALALISKRDQNSSCKYLFVYFLSPSLTVYFSFSVQSLACEQNVKACQFHYIQLKVCRVKLFQWTLSSQYSIPVPHLDWMLHLQRLFVLQLKPTESI